MCMSKKPQFKRNNICVRKIIYEIRSNREYRTNAGILQDIIDAVYGAN